MKLFDKLNDIAIVMEDGADDAIVLAVKDLQRDLRYLSGHKDGFAITTDDTAPAIRVQTVSGGTAEAYTISVDDSGITVTGTDALGTVYGIYAVSTKLLHILPVWRVTDVLPKPQEEMYLYNQTIKSTPRPIRYRGWFLNDEDLLCDFRDSGGRRNIDYGYYQQVIHPDVLDMVLETALRMEVNLIIPGSLADIDNPAEEEMIAAVARRGLYVSSHHIEPVGASHFACENYLKKHARAGEEISYISNPGLMEEIWKYYVEKWAKFGDRVVWQLGLRGKGDKAVWKSDPNIADSDAARGGVVSKAINTQYRLISEALGHTDFPSTITLWSEMSTLYGKGCLDIPKKSTIVLSDIGHSQMFSDSFYSIPRDTQRNYGIYYHTSFWYEGPHLTEGCDLRKMTFSYREAEKMNSLTYSMVNISNLRPVHFSVWFNSFIMNDPKGFNMDETLDIMLSGLYGNDAAAIKPLLADYYNCFAVLQTEDLLYRYNLVGVQRHEYDKLDFPEFCATDGYLRYSGIKMKKGMYYAKDDALFGKTITDSMERFHALYKKMCALEAELSPESREYFCKFLKFETYYMAQISRWVLAIRSVLHDKDDAVRRQSLEAGLDILADILEKRKVLEQGKWEGWHDGDKKIGIRDLITLTKDAYREGVVKPLPNKNHVAF